MSNMNIMVMPKVLHLVSDELARTWNWEPNSEKVDSNVKIISIDKIDSYLEGKSISLPNYINVGDVLVRHPFEPNTYVSVEKASHTIRTSKFFKVSEIAQILGAVKYNIEAAWEEISERRWDVNGSISYDVVKPTFSIHNEKIMIQTMGLSISDEYDGIAAISDNSQKKAEEISKNYGLWEDESIRALIRQRNPNESNRLKGRSYMLDMSSETNELLDAAFSLTIMEGIFNLNTSIKRAVKVQEKITLKISFEFPDD